MALQVSEYDCEADAVWIIAEGKADATDEINYKFGHVLDYDSATYKPVALELVLCVSAYIPLLPEHGYDTETDTLTFSGKGCERTELVTANEDLVAHWAYDDEDPDPEFYIPVAVELRNASKHFAPVIARLTG